MHPITCWLAIRLLPGGHGRQKLLFESATHRKWPANKIATDVAIKKNKYKYVQVSETWTIELCITCWFSFQLELEGQFITWEAFPATINSRFYPFQTVRRGTWTASGSTWQAEWRPPIPRGVGTPWHITHGVWSTWKQCKILQKFNECSENKGGTLSSANSVCLNRS